MIAIDTNILVRYFAEDDEVQTKLAKRFIETRLTPSDIGFVSLITLVELLWVLNDTYKIQRAVQAEIVRQLLEAQTLIVEREDLVRSSLALNAGDIADHIIHLIGRSSGCSKTVTFDKKFARLEGVELLS